jgi:hypothetical protein
MGAAEFISPDAAFAARGGREAPEALLAEALSWIAGRIDTRRCMTTRPRALRGSRPTLGGDVAVALDGPVLPIPSWKFAIEVYDAAGSRPSSRALSTDQRRRLARTGHEGRFVIELKTPGTEPTGSCVSPVLRPIGGGTMRYTITDGYLIAAPSRVLIDPAIEQRGNGYTLTRSSAIRGAAAHRRSHQRLGLRLGAPRPDDRPAGGESLRRPRLRRAESRRSDGGRKPPPPRHRIRRVRPDRDQLAR